MFIFGYLWNGNMLREGEYKFSSPSNFDVSYNDPVVIREKGTQYWSNFLSLLWSANLYKKIEDT